MFSQNVFLKRSWPMLTQCAGAHRKPRWLPVAKSKVFRIPTRPVITEEERIELLRLHSNYKTQMRAIRRFYHEDMIKEKSTRDSASSAMSQRIEAEDWERCVELNEKWNAQVALERVDRRKLQLAASEDYALKRMEAKDKVFQARISKASEQIRQQKELSHTFITPETLDEAIDQALANPVDYNFAIDLKGNRYPGSETLTSSRDEKEKKATQAV